MHVPAMPPPTIRGTYPVVSFDDGIVSFETVATSDFASKGKLELFENTTTIVGIEEVNDFFLPFYKN